MTWTDSSDSAVIENPAESPFEASPVAAGTVPDRVDPITEPIHDTVTVASAPAPDNQQRPGFLDQLLAAPEPVAPPAPEPFVPESLAPEPPEAVAVEPSEPEPLVPDRNGSRGESDIAPQGGQHRRAENPQTYGRHSRSAD